MAPNFLDKDLNDRMIAAIIATSSNSIKNVDIHRLINDPNVTLNNVDWYLRKIRQQAKQMQGDGKDSESPGPKAPKTPKTKAAPKKDGVKTGRVSKKKAAASKVNHDAAEDAFGDSDDGEGVPEGLDSSVKSEPLDEPTGFGDEEV